MHILISSAIALFVVALLAMAEDLTDAEIKKNPY